MRLSEVVQTTGFLDHAVKVAEVADRRAFFADRCRGRQVLHVGCADVPVFDPDTNLHVHLARFAEHLDGLDTSVEGLQVLEKHVAGDYYDAASLVRGEYDVVLAPEVIEHVPDAHAFLKEIFSIKATTYLVTAPHLAWFREMRSEPGVFHERVHPDHKAWYSPYTLLAALRPFIHPERDDVEVFVFHGGASVGVAVHKPFEPARRAPKVAVDADDPLSVAAALEARGETGRALTVLAGARGGGDERGLFSAHVALLLRLGQHMEALRQGLDWLRRHDGDRGALLVCAVAAEGIGEHEHARRWRAAAQG